MALDSKIRKLFDNQIPKLISQAYYLFGTGEVDVAICKLEKAEKDYLSYNLHNLQVELFFAVSFGMMYDSLGLYLGAINAYVAAKSIADKMLDTNPDKALPFNGLGDTLKRTSIHSHK